MGIYCMNKRLEFLLSGLLSIIFVTLITLTTIFGLIILGVTLVILVFGFGGPRVRRYSINVWEGLDNFLSTVTGGDPDESVSSRLGKARERGSGWTPVAFAVDLVARVFFNDLDHCKRSIERDEGKGQVTTY